MGAVQIGTPLFAWRIFFQTLQVRRPNSCQAMADSLSQYEAPLSLSNESGDQCALFLAMSRVPESSDERQSEAVNSQILEAQPDRLRSSHSDSMASQWDTALRQAYHLFKVFDQCSVQVLHNQRGFEISCDVQIRFFDFHRIQRNIYQASQVASCVLIPSTSCLPRFLAAMPNTTFIRSTSRCSPQYHINGGESHPPVATRSPHATHERLYGWDWLSIRAAGF